MATALPHQTPVVWTDGLHRAVLPNGLTVLIQPVPDAPAVAVATRVRAGFLDEPDHWVGISHVLEHMFFKGTPTRGVGAIAREIKAAGGYVNAATSYDYTIYYAVLPVRRWATAVAVQADAIQHALLDQGELDRELRVIVEEARRKLDSPSAVVQETLHEVLYDRHRIRRWRIGTEEGLLRLTREDLEAYYRSRYVPAATIVTVTGGVTVDEALAEVESHFGGWAPGIPAVNPSPSEPPRRERRVRTLRGDVRQADLVLGWRSPGALHPDTQLLDIAAVALSAGRASRLYRALRERGLVSSVGAWNYTPGDTGVFSIALGLEPERLREALRAAGEELAAFLARGMSEDEFARVETIQRARWARRFETVEGRAFELAAAEALDGAELLDREYARLLQLTPDLVQDAAARHLLPEAVGAVAYLPGSSGEALSGEMVSAGFMGDAATAVSQGSTPVVPAASRPVRPLASREVHRVLHVELPGVDLLIRRKEGTPLVSVGCYRVRPGFDPPGGAGLAMLAVRSAVRGAGAWDGARLSDAFERLGGAATPVLSVEALGFQASVLADSLGPAATLLAALLHEPHYTSESVAVERELLAEEAGHAADDMFRWPLQLAYRAAFGEAGYGLPVLGTPESVRSLTVEQVREWHRVALAAGRTTVVAVGDVDPRAAAELLASAFDRGERRTAIVPPRPEVLDVRAGARQEETRDKAQTAVAMLFPGPSRRAVDRHAAEVWAALAGGLGGTLFEALRDRRSLAYTVAAMPWQRRHSGALLTYIATTPAREDEAREAMLEELARMAIAPPSEEERARAVEYVAGRGEVARQSNGALVGEILDAWLQGEGLEELENPEAAYRAVTGEDIRAVADRYLRASLRVEGVVRGRNKGR